MSKADRVRWEGGIGDKSGFVCTVLAAASSRFASAMAAVLSEWSSSLVTSNTIMQLAAGASLSITCLKSTDK